MSVKTESGWSVVELEGAPDVLGDAGPPGGVERRSCVSMLGGGGTGSFSSVPLISGAHALIMRSSAAALRRSARMLPRRRRRRSCCSRNRLTNTSVNVIASPSVVTLASATTCWSGRSYPVLRPA